MFVWLRGWLVLTGSLRRCTLVLCLVCDVAVVVSHAEALSLQAIAEGYGSSTVTAAETEGKVMERQRGAGCEGRGMQRQGCMCRRRCCHLEGSGGDGW